MGSTASGLGLFDGSGQARSLTRRALIGILWGFSGSAVQALLQILVTAVLARLLTPADFGLINAALVAVGFSAMFSQLGIGPAVVQRASLDERHIRTAFTGSLMLALLLFALLTIASGRIASFFALPALAPVLRSMALLFPLQGFSAVAEALMQRRLRFRELARIQVASYVIGYGLVGVALAYCRRDVWALVAAQMAQACTRAMAILVIQPHPKGLKLDLAALRNLVTFGAGVTIARLGNHAANQGDSVVVGRLLGAGLLGAYGRAYQMVVAPATLVGQVLDTVLFPAMASVQHEPERLATAYRRGVAFIALATVPASVILFVLAPEIVLTLLGPGWAEAMPPFRVFVAALLFRTEYKMSDCLCRAAGAIYGSAWRQAVYAVLAIGGAWVGARWHLAGAAAGVLVAIVAKYVLMAQLSLRLLPLTLHDLISAHAPAFLLGAISVVVTWGTCMPMRTHNVTPLLVLLASSAAALLSILLLASLFPGYLLGRDGVAMLRTLMVHLAKGNRLSRNLGK